MINLPDLSLALQIFALLNPLASFPIIMAAYRKKMNIKKIAASAVIVAFAVALVIVFVGPALFSMFSITLDSFRIAGGIVLLLLGIHMVRPSSDDDKKEVTSIDSTISIIATPMLTGPATISFLTIKSYEIGQWSVLSGLLFAFILVGFVFLLFAFTISKINTKLIDITSRVLGLFLTAVSIEMIAKGISGIVAAAV